MGSPVDDALDNLSRIVGEHKGPTTGGWYAISQVRSALEQLREERDAWKQRHIDSERDWRKEWLAREAAEAEVQRLGALVGMALDPTRWDEFLLTATPPVGGGAGVHSADPTQVTPEMMRDAGRGATAGGGAK